MIAVPKISDVDAAFPTKSAVAFVPPLSSIPREFQNGSGKWCRFFAACFYFGPRLNMKRFGLVPKEGVVAADAWRALQTVMGCFALKHEHKEAAVAYLASEWFADARWERTDNGEVVAFDDAELEAAWLQKNGSS